MKLLFALILFVAPSLSWAACDLCADLTRLHVEFKAARGSDAQNGILVKAADALDNLGAPKRLLSDDEARAIVEFLNNTLAADPGYSLIQSQAKMLVHNKKILKDEIAKLSKRDAKELSIALKIAVDQEGLRW